MEESCRQVLKKSVGEKCWRRALERSIWEDRGRTVLGKSVGKACSRDSREVLGKSWREVLEKSVVEKCWRRVCIGRLLDL